MERRDLKIKSMKVRTYSSVTKEETPLIVFIHGLGGVGLNCIELTEMLSEYNFLAIDLPGHGGSEQLTTNFDMKSLTEWLNDIITHLDLKPFFLIGHSYGGDLVIHYTKAYPKRVRKLLLLDGGYYNKKYQYDLIKKLHQKGQWLGRPVDSLEKECAYYREDFDNYTFSTMADYKKQVIKEFDRLTPSLFKALEVVMKACDEGLSFIATGETAVKAIKAMYKMPSADIINALEVETLLLVSTEPTHYRDLRQQLLQAIEQNDGFTYTFVPDTSHFLYWDKPEIICDYIRGFFKEGK